MRRKPLVERLGAILFATSSQVERGAIGFRLIASPALSLVMFLSRDRLPYWEYAIGAVVVMFVTNIWLGYANRTNRITPNRSALWGSLIDTGLLLIISSLAIRASAEISATSEMWLVFPLVILGFVYRARPFAGIAYSILLTTWYSAHILMYFDPGDRAVTELPIRATFFVLMGGLAAVLGNSLRQQGADPD
ncbi:MAG: hypothetical protein QF357_00770 [Dehalococcoidia bacterium]|nr:hypothetical protein [Dehalococcoidia bacterium]